MKKIGIIKDFTYVLAIVLIIVVAVIFIAGKFGIGGVRALVVQSGSMEPGISTKSIVITVPSNFYKKNDVITFRQSGRESVLVTHRVYEIKNTSRGNEFVTKGDANEEADNETILAKYIIGRVVFVIPFLGYIVSFTQTQLGFTLLIIIPGVLIIYSELLNIKNQLVKFIVARKARRIVRPFK